MAWCFEDEATAATDEILDRLRTEHAMAPLIWPLEVANVLATAQRRRRLTEAQSRRFSTLLAQLPIELDDYPDDIDTLLGAARRHELSSYDATYLLLAERHGIPIATLDDRLGAAARAAGVGLLIAG